MRHPVSIFFKAHLNQMGSIIVRFQLLHGLSKKLLARLGMGEQSISFGVLEIVCRSDGRLQVRLTVRLKSPKLPFRIFPKLGELRQHRN